MKLLSTIILLSICSLLPAEEIFPDLEGDALVQALRERYRPQQTLTYSQARQRMFREIDNHNGSVTLCYTGGQFATNGIPPGNVVNTEHTWPQSRFENAPGQNMMKSDLHHLYPTESSVNSRRGNNPFGEIPDQDTLFWYRSSLYQTTPPTAGARDGFSESTNSVFEPREAHKGNAARALFYFYAVYGGQRIDIRWFEPQVSSLLRWNEADPPDDAERERSREIAALQGNENPFVLDPTLAGRVFAGPSPLRGIVRDRALALRAMREGAAPEDRATPADHNINHDGQRIRLAQWNAHEVFSVADANDRIQDYRRFVEDIRPDIVTINEFTSKRELQRIARHMGFSEGQAVASDFVQNDNALHDGFEVGVISRFPITSVLEFDFSTDNVASQGDPEEERLIAPNVPGLANTSAGRGFLRVQIDEIQLMIYVCHLKSSNGLSGNPDRVNAQKREVVAAAIGRQVEADRGTHSGYTFIVVGDMNIGETDDTKKGTQLTNDVADGYDDTHAIFARGLAGGARLQSKTVNLGLETFDSDQFAGSGPIDCIYATGAAAAQISAATRGAITYNSDHFPVWVDWQPSAGPAPSPDALADNNAEIRPATVPRPVLPSPAVRADTPRPGSPNRAAPVDAPRPVAPNPAVPADAQMDGGDVAAPAAGALRIGAWNIENLGTRDADSTSPSVRDQSPQVLAAYIMESQVEVLALEEIHDNDQTNSNTPGHAPWRNRLLEETLQLLSNQTNSEWKYELTPPSSANNRQQMTGVAWNSSKVTLLTRRSIAVAGGTFQGLDIWARRPEAFHFRVGNGGTDFALVPLHMKSNSDGPTNGRRVREREAAQLSQALPALRAALQGEADIVLLGDTNMNHNEQTAANIWGADFTDLNADERYTYIKPFNNQPFPPFDRILIPIGQPEFQTTEQFIHGPYGDTEAGQAIWRTDHLRKRSDHLLIFADIQVTADDD